MAEDLFTRLKEFCSCVDVDEADVVELINVVSSATGWAVNPCETFLKGPRRELIDLPDCMDCAYEFTPYFHPFDPQTFSFKLIEITDEGEGAHECDFVFIGSKAVFRVKTGLPTCGCAPCSCGCKSEYKLLVTYEAGYEDDVPECLFPVFCNLLEVIHAKNKCECGCGCEGQETNTEPIYAKGDIVTVQLETDLGKMLVAEYKREIGMISLIRKNDFWGFVV